MQKCEQEVVQEYGPEVGQEYEQEVVQVYEQEVMQEWPGSGEIQVTYIIHILFSLVYNMQCSFCTISKG